MTQGLIGDIGGTNARFALTDGNQYTNERIFLRKPFNSLAEAVEFYLASHADGVRPEYASISLAAPITGDTVQMVNGDKKWHFSQLDEAARLRMKLSLMNDFKAVALAVPHFKSSELIQIGRGTPVNEAPKVVSGPGTGLGMAGLTWNGTEYMPVSSEGGHATMPARTITDFRIFQKLNEKYGHVSIERVCSGPGLIDIYDTLNTSDILHFPHHGPVRTSEEICEAARKRECWVSSEAVNRMLGYFGNAVGNLALTFNASGGVYIPSSIIKNLGKDFVEQSPFRQEFEHRGGRYREFLANVPTYVIDHPFPAFVGLQADLRRQMPG